ncbi:hypothetical protein ScalyP_jg336 [Parmales sp. scaly parma]|nr:hypothetical protein ScalyP_jg336 [Parmales sp. scaly parma]
MGQATSAPAPVPATSNSFTNDDGMMGLLASLLPLGAFNFIGFTYKVKNDPKGDDPKYYTVPMAKKDLQALLDLMIKDTNTMSPETLAHIHHLLPGAKLKLVDGKLVVFEIASTTKTGKGRLNVRGLCKFLNRIKDMERDPARHLIETKIDLAAPCSEEVLAAAFGTNVATKSEKKKRKRKAAPPPPPATPFAVAQAHIVKDRNTLVMLLRFLFFLDSKGHLNAHGVKFLAALTKLGPKLFTMKSKDRAALIDSVRKQIPGHFKGEELKAVLKKWSQVSFCNIAVDDEAVTVQPDACACGSVAENENASLASSEAIAGKLPILVNALEQIYKPYVVDDRVEVGFLNVVKGGTNIATDRLRLFLERLKGGEDFDGSTHLEHVTVFQELVRQYGPFPFTVHVVIEGIQRMHEKLHEKEFRSTTESVLNFETAREKASLKEFKRLGGNLEFKGKTRN